MNPIEREHAARGGQELGGEDRAGQVGGMVGAIEIAVRPVAGIGDRVVIEERLEVQRHLAAVAPAGRLCRRPGSEKNKNRANEGLQKAQGVRTSISSPCRLGGSRLGHNLRISCRGSVVR